MKKNLLLILVLLLSLFACKSNEEKPNETDKPVREELYVVESLEGSSIYPNLTNYYLDTRMGNHLLVLIPTLNQSGVYSYSNDNESNFRWSFMFDENTDVDSFINALDDYVAAKEDSIDSKAYFIDGTGQRLIETNGLKEYFYIVNIKDLSLRINLIFNEEDLNEDDIRLLNELKEVYALNLLDLKEANKVNEEEIIDENDDEQEENHEEFEEFFEPEQVEEN